MYSVKGDGMLIYSDVSPTESNKASSPKLTLKDNSAGSLEITLPTGNVGYDILKRMTSEIVVYRDNQSEWRGRIIAEDMDFWNNRILTCEGALAYLNDTTQPQHKYSEGTTVRTFLEAVLKEHNKRFTDERYRFYADYIYNADKELPEIVTDYENTLDCINTNIIEYFECHIRLEQKDGKNYLSFVKDEALFSENAQTIRFGENLLDFTKNWDLTDLATVIIPRGEKIEVVADEDTSDLDTFVTLSGIPYQNEDAKDEIGEYLRYKEGDEIPEGFEVGQLVREIDENGELTGQLVYEYNDILDKNGNKLKKYEEVTDNGKKYLVLEPVREFEPDTKNYKVKTRTDPVTIRVDMQESGKDHSVVEFLEDGEVVSKIVTDGLYADVYLKNQNGEFYSLKEQYGWVEQVVDFSEAKTSVELLKKTREYITEQRFDQMKLEVSAVDLRYLSDKAEPLKILDRMRCISFPHRLNELFTITELSIELDKPDSACYTLEKTVSFSPRGSSSLSSSMSAVTAELKSPHSSVLTQAKSDADKILREKTNGYVSLVTDIEGGRHSEALVVSSGKDYKHSSHFWIWNSNGLGHYEETGETDSVNGDNENVYGTWVIDGKAYKVNVGITMDGAIVANRITVGHMSADRVRTGILASQDDNVVWNLNAEATVYNGKTYDGGSLTIKKGSITLGSDTNDIPKFEVTNEGYITATYGHIGGFEITSEDIHNDSMSLDEVGLHLWSDGTNVGRIGTTKWITNPAYKLLAMNLEHDAAGISWGYRENISDEYYTAKMAYVINPHGKYTEGNTLYIHGNANLCGYVLKNATIDPNDCNVDGGKSISECLLLTPGAINADGTIDSSKTKTIRIKNGFVLS